jgi:hypothetical protein
MKYIHALSFALISSFGLAHATYLNSMTATTQDTTLRVRQANNYKWGVVSTASGDLGVAVWGVGSGYYATGILGTAWGTGVKAEATNTYGNGMESYPGGRGTGLYTSGGMYGVSSSATSYDGYDSPRGGNFEASYGDYTYGVYSSAWGGTYETWSGYFAGDVYVGGSFVNSSDQMFKKDIRPISGGLSKVMALKPRAYEMKTQEFEGFLQLPKGVQYGLIAQDLEGVMPELVKPSSAPARLTSDEKKKGVKKDPLKFKSVNYMALIPVMIEAMQEQQALIEKQQARIEALERGAK